VVASRVINGGIIIDSNISEKPANDSGISEAAMAKK